MSESVYSLTVNDIKRIMSDIGEPSYRGDQIMEWVYQKNVIDYAGMSNISIELREKLQGCLSLDLLEVDKQLLSKSDGSIKYLFALSDGEFIETVYIPQSYGNSICLSTQVGCRMGCRICASRENGFRRNLTAGEMVQQVMTVMEKTENRNNGTGRLISSIVLMGIGEPLDNLTEVIKFIRIINYKHALNFGQRNITVSTSGIVPRIYELAEENLQITLAVSLHASDDGKRSQIMPVNKQYNIKVLLEACREYVIKTGRRITFEYVMIDGFNDGEEDARQLIEKVRGINCHVNLIQFNHIDGSIFMPSKEVSVRKFYKLLESSGQPVTLRHSKGQDIDAACGQLRNSSFQK